MKCCRGVLKARGLTSRRQKVPRVGCRMQKVSFLRAPRAGRRGGYRMRPRLLQHLPLRQGTLIKGAGREGGREGKMSPLSWPSVACQLPAPYEDTWCGRPAGSLVRRVRKFDSHRTAREFANSYFKKDGFDMTCSRELESRKPFFWGFFGNADSKTFP